MHEASRIGDRCQHLGTLPDYRDETDTRSAWDMSAVRESIEPGQPARTIVPHLPLALLEAMRAQDQPHEMLEEEDPTISLPRRFGLTGVVATQIERYRDAARRGRAVPVDDVIDLIRLVLRRPDAPEILRQAGHLAARQYFERMPRSATSALGILPRRTAAAAARRGARKLLQRLHGEGRLEVVRKPWRIRLFDPITAHLDDLGAAPCSFFTAALEELLFLYTRNRPQFTHSACSALGGEYCEWVVAE